MSSDRSQSSRRAHRDENCTRIEQIVGDYIDRLNRGERIGASDVLDAHPALGPEILEHLESFTDLDSSAPAPLGILGDYTLRRQIGRGGMGVVYEAWEGSMDRVVALKVLPAGVAADDRAFQRFMQEAKTAGKLSHQNIVPVYSTGVKEGTPWFSMEFVEGETLTQILARVKEAEPEAETPFGKKDRPAYFEKFAEAFADVADGLQHAHSKGVIHRDIKPSNLILDGDGRLRILDFGLARLEGQEALTVSGDFVGTPLYMSPEQARRKKIPIDHRTDVYSLGATMYEAICGQPPFRGKDHADTLSQIIERDPWEPRKINQRVPKDLETIVLKCLRKDCDDRYGTAEALGQDLRRFVRGDPVEARPQTRVEKSVRWLRRRRALVAAFLVSLAITSGLGLLLEKQRQERIELKRKQYTSDVFAELDRIQQGYHSFEAAGGEPSSLGAFEFLLPGDLTLLGGENTRALIEEAIASLETISASDPERPDARYHMARGLLLLGKKNEAALELRETLKRTPDFVPAGLLLEKLATEKRRPASSLAWKSTADLPQWAVLWIEAHRAMQEKRWREAIDAQEALARLESENGALFAGSSLETLLNSARAKLELRDYHGAVEDLSTARWDWPQYLEPALLLGKTYFLQGERGQAEKTFRRLFVAAKRPNEAAFWIALVYRSLGEFGKAEKWADAVKAEQVKLRLRAIFLIDQFSMKEAREVASQAIALNGRDWVSRLIFAAASLLSLMSPDATYEEHLENISRQLEKADQLHPDHAPTHAFLGLTRRGQGRLDEAASLCEEAIRLDPSDPNGYWILGWVEQERGDAAKAEKLLREAPVRHAAILCVLGQLYQRQGRFREALEQLDLALEARPNYADARRIRGEVFLALGNHERASEVFQAMETLPRSYGVGHERLALLYWKKNDLQKARISAAAALQKDDNLRIARHLLDWLSDRERGMDSARSHLQKLAEDLRAYPPLAKIFRQEIEGALSESGP